MEAEVKASETHCGRRKAMRMRRVMILVCHLSGLNLTSPCSDDEQSPHPGEQPADRFVRNQ